MPVIKFQILAKDKKSKFQDQYFLKEIQSDLVGLKSTSVQITNPVLRQAS